MMGDVAEKSSKSEFPMTFEDVMADEDSFSTIEGLSIDLKAMV
jgi:hypothetical protein